jgi:U3 small nucleolar RNA-associated protein 5
VLSVSQPGVVANTCDRLSPQLALSFLAACVARLQAKPVRGAHLAKWIRALLVAHAAHFANSPQAAGLLSALYSILDTRLALYRPLLALSGRLDLVLAAHARGKRAGAQGHGGSGEDGLPVVYDEPDGPEPEAEDARGGALDSEDGVSDEDGDEEAAEEEEVEEHWETDDEP